MTSRRRLIACTGTFTSFGCCRCDGGWGELMPHSDAGVRSRPTPGARTVGAAGPTSSPGAETVRHGDAGQHLSQAASVPVRGRHDRQHTRRRRRRTWPVRQPCRRRVADLVPGAAARGCRPRSERDACPGRRTPARAASRRRRHRRRGPWCPGHATTPAGRTIPRRAGRPAARPAGGGPPRPAGRPACRHPACRVTQPNPTAVDVERLEGSEPVVVRAAAYSGLQVLAGVAQPQRDVLRRVEDLALDDQRVARRRAASSTTRSRQSWPRTCSQLASSWHQPPPSRCQAADRHDQRGTASSPGRPASR